MHRLGIVVSIVLLGLVALSGRIAIGATSEAPPAAPAEHPVVGAWRWENDPADAADDSYGVFHADGTYVEVTTNVGVGMGVWRATDEQSAEVLFVFQDTDPSGSAFAPGTGTFTLSLQVDDAGNALDAAGSLKALSPDGEVKVEADDFRFTATRLDMAPARSSRTPGMTRHGIGPTP